MLSDYCTSTQQTKWLYDRNRITILRTRANREARLALLAKIRSGAAEAGGGGGGASANKTESTDGGGGAAAAAAATAPSPLVPSKWYASGYSVSDAQNDALSLRQLQQQQYDEAYDDSVFPNAPLTPDEEALLVRFYAGKLPLLIGMEAQIPRLKRDAKVAATASLLFRRFYLSNSVMVHDPKAVMVAAAFLASKVEDATVDIRYLEEGTKIMQSHVTQSEIISAELHLLTGVNFELLCFHPYKTVLALTEDLRTFLKSGRGTTLAVFPPPHEQRPVVGQDLSPIHDEARRIVDDAVVSDMPLMYSPGQIGLAAMIVANDELQKQQQRESQKKADGGGGDGSQPNSNKTVVPNIDLVGYIRARFEGHTEEEIAILSRQMNELGVMLRGLKNGEYGCGNHKIDMGAMKVVYKKLKKCKDGASVKKKKKKKKRKAAAGDGAEAKVAKMD